MPAATKPITAALLTQDTLSKKQPFGVSAKLMHSRNIKSSVGEGSRAVILKVLNSTRSHLDETLSSHGYY